MKQNIFETQQRAKELIQQAMNIWKASDQSQNLEGLEKDPVYSVIMGAIAYQANELDNEIEELKTEIFEEFEKTLSVGAAGNPVPATLVLQTNAVGNTPIDIDANVRFGCGGEENFIPVLESRLFNIHDMMVRRIDGRRWKVSLEFPEAIDNLDGMTFAISELPFHDLSVSLLQDGNDIPLEIIAPWDSANLPMSEPFSLDTLMYNRMYSVTDGGTRGNISPYSCFMAMDLYSRQNLSLFMFSMKNDNRRFHSSTHIDLCFEFDGVGDGFQFDNAQIAFNILLLANVRIKTVTLTGKMPLARLTGNSNDEDFIHLLRPAQDQIYSSVPISVRRIATERFNQSRLAKRLVELVEHYNSDYYAFLQMEPTQSDTHIQRISQSLKALLNLMQIDNVETEGYYAMLPHNGNVDGLSLDIRYLTTAGGSLALSQDMMVMVPKGLDQNRTRQLVAPQKGLNAIRDTQAEASLRRYLMTTNDRLVTPADLKLFCYTELQNRYSVVRDIIDNISVKHEPFNQGTYHTYCLKVRIKLVANNFVKRAFEGRVESIENYLEKMMQTRSTGIYPIKVKIIMQ